MAAKIKPLNAVLSYKRIAKDVGNTVTCIVFFEFVFLQHPLISKRLCGSGMHVVLKRKQSMEKKTNVIQKFCHLWVV